MSARTTWRAKPCGWRDRERVVALGEEFGPAGPMVLDLLEELAKEQRHGDQVRTGLRAVARSTFLPRGQEGQVLARQILEFAHKIGAVDALAISDDADLTVHATLSGFEQDQGRGYEAVTKANQRAAACPDIPDNEPSCPESSDDVQVCPPTEQNRTEQNRTEEPETPMSNASRSTTATTIDRSVVAELFDHWRQVCRHPQAKPTTERLRAIKARLRDGYTPAQIRRAIDGAAAAAFVNAHGKRFDDLTLICRNGSKLEDFIDRAGRPPGHQPGPGARPSRQAAALAGLLANEQTINERQAA